MKIEIEIEIEIEIKLNIYLASIAAQKIQKNLIGEFELVSLKEIDRFSLRPIKMIDENLTIDQAIASYLQSVKSIQSILVQVENGILRVGVFFSSNEAMAFCIELSKATIQRLATYQLAIDVVCYPCSS